MKRGVRIGGAAAFVWLCGCGTELEHGLDERQANEVVAALERAGIAADKTSDDGPDRYKVVVGRGEAGAAFQVLEARSLPRQVGKGVGEAFAEKGLLPSATSERARLGASIATDLERSLEGLPQVVSARVHIALPDEDPLHAGSAHPRPTASVLLRAGGPLTVSDGDLKRLIAGAVQGLEAADVDVVVAAAPSGAEVQLAEVGPLRVATGSRGLLVGLLSAALGFVLALSVVIVAGAMRMAALRRELEKKR